MAKKQEPEKVQEIIRVLGRRVVLRQIDRGSISEGGIHIPEMAQEDGRLAEVVAVGNLTEYGLEPGNTVLITKWRGSAIECNGEELKVIDESDCWMVVGVNSKPDSE